MSQLSPSQIWQTLDSKTKPPRSLGRLEHLAARLACIQNQIPPRVDRPAILIFAADHGITKNHPVSAFPREVTAQMLQNFADGGAAICRLARVANAQLRVIDVGVDSETQVAGIETQRVARGTSDFLEGNAMSEAQTLAALQTGAESAFTSIENGANVLAFGEMGIGNTTSAAALLALLTSAPAEIVVGRGTGVGDAALLQKIEVVRRAVEKHGEKKTALEKLGAVGGLEIAALCGALEASVKCRVPVVIDGFIVSVAALCADLMNDGNLREGLIFSHQGAETGHKFALEKLGATNENAPLLDWNLRLGEASGAALVLPLLQSAASLFSMASFDNAGVSQAN